MKCRFVVTLWILWLPQEILSRPDPTAADSAEAYANSEPTDIDPVGDYGDQLDGEWESDALDVPDEHQNDTEDTEQNPDYTKATPEHPEGQIDATPDTSNETSSENAKEAEAKTPVSSSKSLEVPSSGKAQESEEKGESPPETYPEVADVTGKKVPVESKNEPEKEVSPRKEASSQEADKAEKEGPASSTQGLEEEGPESRGKETVPELMKGAEKKGLTRSPKQPEGNNLPNKPEKTVSKEVEQKKRTSKSPTRAAPADKSKYQITRNQPTSTADRKNINQNQHLSPVGYGNNQEQTKQRKQKPENPKTGTKSTKMPNPNHEEFVGNISDLISTIGKKVGSFEDINRKPRAEGQLKRSLPSTGAVAPKTVGSKLAKKSIPKADLAKQAKSPPYSNPLFRKKLPPTREMELSSKSKNKPSKTSGSRHLPASKRDLVVIAHGPGADPTREKSGMEDYERLMAQRAEQLDEPEGEKLISVKQLPKRLTTVTGDFGAIADQLGNNIRSVSAANKDMTSRRGLASKIPVKQVALTRRGPQDDSDEQYDDENEVGARGENCKCYNKYSAFNVVRRTAKRVIRAVRDGTNRIYDGVDFTIAKSKDVKDAVKSDIVDPALQMIPVVGPVVGAVVDTGDMIADSAISGARQVVQGGKGLNDGVFSGVEGMLKKDKTCRCAETREEDVAD